MDCRKQEQKQTKGPERQPSIFTVVSFKAILPWKKINGKKAPCKRKVLLPTSPVIAELDFCCLAELKGPFRNFSINLIRMSGAPLHTFSPAHQ